MVGVEITVAMVQLKQLKSNKRQKTHQQYYGYLLQNRNQFFHKTKRKKKRKKNDNERKKKEKKKFKEKDLKRNN